MYFVRKNNRNNSLFGDFFDDLFDSRSLKTNVSMKTDIKDEGDKYLLDIDLPGFNKEDIKVSYEDGYLTISATHEERNDEQDNNGIYIRRERRFGSCSRSFYVGNVIQENINANYKNGILSITVPKEDQKKVETKKFIAIE